MPGPRRFRAMSVIACSVSAAALILAGVAVAAIWVPMRHVALTDDQFFAATAAIAAVILWTGRWLANVIATCGIAFVIEAMLSQRAWYRRRLGTATGPLRRLQSPRRVR